MKRVFAVLATIAVIGVWLADIAHASPPPGADVAHENTTCAEHGGFHSLGEHGSVHDIGVHNPLSNGRPGATSWTFPSNTGSTTGGNNNLICGGGNVPAPFQ